MMDVRGIMQKLLESQELKRNLADVFCAGIGTTNQFQEMDLADHLRRARGEQWYAASNDAFSPRIEGWIEGMPEILIDLFQKSVIENLPSPAVLTAEELASIAVAQLAGLPLRQSENDEVARAYHRFMTFALSESDENRLGDTHLEFGRWLCESDEDYDAVFPGSGGELLWSSLSGFSLCAFATGRDHLDTYAYMVGQLTAHCSEGALVDAEAELNHVADSIAKTVWLSLTRTERMRELPSDIADTLETDEVDCGCGHVTYLTQGDGKRIVSSCLSAFWRESHLADDTLLDRLRNATVLLAHADQAGADPISLSLSFAAIEALVCEKDELPVNKQIKRHVATLLVVNSEFRKSKERVVGKLYDIRSDVLHGTKVGASPETSEAVRRIAAGVVRAVTCWRESQLSSPLN